MPCPSSSLLWAGPGRGSLLGQYLGKALGQDPAFLVSPCQHQGWGRGPAPSAVLPSLELLCQATSQNSPWKVSFSASSWLSRDANLDPICVLESLTLPTQDLDALIPLIYLLSTCSGPRAKNWVVKWTDSWNLVGEVRIRQ